MKRAVVFDFMRTLYDPLTASLYGGVREMLTNLQGERRLFLYSRQDRSRTELLRELGIDECFEAAYFSSHKNADELRGILKSHQIEPAQCIVVGDMLNSELCAGSEIGCETIWFQHGIFDGMTASELPCAPTHTVSAISELQTLLQQIG